jgi:hypothetical protein
MRGIGKALWATVSVIALVAGASLLPSQASAQIDIPGMVFGAVRGGLPPGGGGTFRGGRRGHVHETRHEHRSKDTKDDEEPTEHGATVGGKSGPDQISPAVGKTEPPPPSQPQPQTAATTPAPKSNSEEPVFSPSR